jgi:hypothetical protein
MHKNDETPQPADTGLPYATDEITFPSLGKVAVLLIIFTIFSSVLAGGAYWLFVVHETVPAAHVLEATPSPPDPNVPILQKDPVAEIHKFRADEYDSERSYSHWKDGDGKNSLRIPISRAMEIVKAHGLPPAKSNGAATTSASGAASGSNTSGAAIPPAGARP